MEQSVTAPIAGPLSPQSFESGAPMPDATDQPILLCYDGSDDAFRAIEFAGSLFPGRSAVVLSVWEHYSVLSGVQRVDDSLVQEATEALAADGCDRARAAGFTATPAAVQAHHGVAEAIIDAADEHDAMLVVMGTRGNTGIRSLLLGSVSHGVAHHAHRPLLIVPSQSLAEARTAGARR
jgi:nucleotide-binding universal stress UspA family protein